ncbi:MAG: phage shock protein operon transcriptional activator [Xanthomonadales bacterium]|nr:phage shock protein operon transcriptional activator [Gammaproteobacteria bacterium]MBT8053836.1 phage shock protein operon transcriptional activator [Gammaproteobacteria bacterium]NND56417.1 phage shock protein operon transcriptional activator [Xanthomonadales bacterium]NNK51803.1 phage shock protein operon transcriptional activator [Xanthomonadales bacterium]
MDRQQEQPLIGEAPVFLEILERVSRVAQLNRPVLIIGERGTGKELIAARIHYLSPRWDRPFVKLNCAALAESLLETELFGHEAGSFTGATRRRLGRFELANEGSLFLDELANTSDRVQEKVLRVIEYGELERVGGNDTIRTDVRIIGATNEDLPALAEQGRFRADLLDRLAFDVITLPPLRERQEDILPLAEHFAVKMSGELGLELFAGFSESARDLLLEYAWPGNVRELKNVVERAVYTSLGEDDPISEINFDPFDSPWRPGNAPEAAEISLTDRSPQEPYGFKEYIQEMEIELLQAALQRCRFNQKKTAEFLGMTYHQLRGYLRKYELTDSEED